MSGPDLMAVRSIVVYAFHFKKWNDQYHDGSRGKVWESAELLGSWWCMKKFFEICIHLSIDLSEVSVSISPGRHLLSLSPRLSVMCRESCLFWRSSSVRRFRLSSQCWWTSSTAPSCCFQRRLGYAARAELSCPSKSPCTTPQCVRNKKSALTTSKKAPRPRFKESAQLRDWCGGLELDELRFWTERKADIQCL